MANSQNALSDIADRVLKGVPATATIFCSDGATVNSGAAAVQIKAAVTGKRHWICWWNLVNKTAGEYPVAELTEDHAGTPVIKARATASAGVSTGLGTSHIVFDPPIEITAGKTIGYQLQSATGDTYASIGGYVES